MTDERLSPDGEGDRHEGPHNAAVAGGRRPAARDRVLAAGALVACGGPTPAAGSSTVTPGATVHASPQAAAEEFRGMLPYVYTSSLVKERPYRKHEDGR